MKTLIKKIIRIMGFEVRRYDVQNSDIARLMNLLNHHDVDLILDVGASDGVYGRKLREYGYFERIVSFEPLLEAHNRLVECAKNDSLWSVAPRMAIGDTEQETVINVSDSSTSSSILDILPNHLKNAPKSAYVKQEVVSLKTLDHIWDVVVPVDCKSVFLKIDTQGYEDKVLEGAKIALSKICGLQIELSFVPLYKGQMLFDDIYRQIREYGFELYAIFPVYFDSANGRILQIDGVFFKL